MSTKFIRKDILDLTPSETDRLIRAFHGIQNLPPEDPNSFFAIAACHGQPFRGPGYSSKDWWGGYCHHGNVLFPLWHRAYVLRLEAALRTIPKCEGLSMPYWNQMRTEKTKVIPDIFVQRKYNLDGKIVENPLYSYKFQRGFFDNLSRINEGIKADFSKPKGYETVRYPYSGLVGLPDIQRTRQHNETISQKGNQDIAGELDDNVKDWLEGNIQIAGLSPRQSEESNVIGMREKYMHSLQAPNYTVFSNTTSAAKWNDDNFGHLIDAQTLALVVSIETPHNGIHLAVGGFDPPGRPVSSKASGDMGENDTASFDPLFFFHHTFIDKVFWSWQVLHQSTDSLEFISEYPGTNSVDSQGPTPGTLAGSWITVNSPLRPFVASNGRELTAKDMFNITRLCYSYDSILKPNEDGPNKPDKPIIRISGVNRTSIAGSFVISIWASSLTSEENPQHAADEGQIQPHEVLIGYEPVFSRWYVPGCANCNNSLLVTVHTPLDQMVLKGKGRQIIVRVMLRNKDSSQLEYLGPDRLGRYFGPLKYLQVQADKGAEVWQTLNFTAVSKL